MLDSMRNGWEGGNTGTPERVAATSSDWIALDPVPDDQYSIELTIVKPSPALVPSAQLQLGREQLSAIRAWAKQLLLFKSQGVQLQQGQLAAGAMIQAARVYNEERVAMSDYLSEIYSTSFQQEHQPLRSAETINAPDSDPRDTSSTRQSRNSNPSYNRPSRRLGGR
jgi:hypothetical protein